MKKLQRLLGSQPEASWACGIRTGAALSLAASLSLVAGCSANSDPSIPFVESANAGSVIEEQNTDYGVVKIAQDDENLSPNNAQSRPVLPYAALIKVGESRSVPAIDPSIIAPSTSWQYTYYVNYPLTIEGKQTKGHKVTLGSSYIQAHEDQKGFSACGDIPVTDSIVDELHYPPAAPEACNLNEIERRFFQSENSFSVEYYCGDKPVSARHYQKIADEKIAFYQLEFSQLTPPQDYSDTNACVELSLYGHDESEGEVNVLADIYGNILSDSYHLQMQLNHIQPQQSFFTLDEAAGEQAHDFVFNFKPFGRYSATQKESGFILWERNPNPLKMRAEFEVVIDDVVAGERQLEGYIEPNW